jgi:hypothetical protein
MREFPQHQTNLKESTSEMNSTTTLQVDARKDVCENLPDVDVNNS